MHPSVGVAAHGVASADRADEGGGVSHYNPRESRCHLYFWWYCIGGASGIKCVAMVNQRVMRKCILLESPPFFVLRFAL